MDPVRGTRTGLMAAGLAIAVTATAAVLTVTGDDDASLRADSTSESSSTSGSSAGGDDTDDGGSGSSEHAADDEYAAIQRVLDARARAIEEGDRMGFLSTLDDASPRFVQQQLVTFDNLRRLGVAEIVYGLEERTLPVTPVKGDDPEIKPDITEHVQIRAVDKDSVSNEVGLTFVQRDGEWLLGAERIDETERTLSSIGSARPWAEGPISVRRAGQVTVVVDRDRDEELAELTARVTRALAYVRSTLGVTNGAPLLVDATTSGNASRLSYEGLAVAGAVFGPAITTTLSTHEPIGVAGWRVKYNPDRLEEFLDDDRVLRHELTHFVLRDKPQPLWLSEGIAEYVGWQTTGMAELVVPSPIYDRFAAGAPQDRLISTEEFRRNPVVGYTLAQALAEELISRGGVPKLLDLLDALARADTKGTPLPRAQAAALQEVYGVSAQEVAAAGYARLLTVNRP